MSIFNTRQKNPNKVVNNHGGVSYGLAPLEDLFSVVMGSFFGESNYYENKTVNGEYKRIEGLVKNVKDSDIEYVLKIAEVGRMLNMKSAPLALLNVCFNDSRFKNSSTLFKQYTPNIMTMPKDINNMLALQLTHFDGLTSQIRKRSKERLEAFSAFSLSKALDKKTRSLCQIQ